MSLTTPILLGPSLSFEQSPGLHYSESPMLSPMQPGTSHLGHNGRAPSQPPHLTGPAQSYVRYYPPPVQPAPPRTTFSTGMQYPMQQATPASLGGGGDPSIGTPGGGQPHHVPLFPPLPMSAVGNPSSAPPPPLQIPSYHQPRGRGSTHVRPFELFHFNSSLSAIFISISAIPIRVVFRLSFSGIAPWYEASQLITGGAFMPKFLVNCSPFTAEQY